MPEKKLTRRDFLKDAGIAAGGVLLASTAFSLAGCGNQNQGTPTDQGTADNGNGQTDQETIKYACLWCNQEFYDRAGLMSHIIATHPGKGFGPIPVAIMVTSIDSQDHLKKRVDELLKRNFFVSVNAGGVIDTVGGDYVKELSQAGFDIAVPATIDATKSYDEKFTPTQSAKQKAELLLGTQVKSYSAASKFAIDEDTAKIIQTLGGGYVFVSSRSTKHPDQSLEPELVPGLPEDVAVAYCYEQSRGLYNQGTDLLAQDVLAMSGSN
jgi:hypothetical protein